MVRVRGGWQGQMRASPPKFVVLLFIGLVVFDGVPLVDALSTKQRASHRDTAGPAWGADAETPIGGSPGATATGLLGVAAQHNGRNSKGVVSTAANQALQRMQRRFGRGGGGDTGATADSRSRTSSAGVVARAALQQLAAMHARAAAATKAAASSRQDSDGSGPRFAHCVAPEDGDSDICTWMHGNRVTSLWNMLLVRWFVWMESFKADSSRKLCVSEWFSHFAFALVVASLLWLDGEGPVDKSRLRQAEGERWAMTATYLAGLVYAYQRLGLFGGDASQRTEEDHLAQPPENGGGADGILSRITGLLANDTLIFLLIVFFATEIGRSVAISHTLSGSHFVSMAFTLYGFAFFRLTFSRSPELSADSQGNALPGFPGLKLPFSIGPLEDFLSC